MMETCWSPPGAETVLTPFSISPIPLLSKCFDLVEGAEPGAYPARLARLGVNNLPPDPAEIVTSVPDTSYRAALLERHCHRSEERRVGKESRPRGPTRGGGIEEVVVCVP